jgi:nitrite reductase/ring-hydroxylating ferredoxin subunit
MNQESCADVCGTSSCSTSNHAASEQAESFSSFSRRNLFRGLSAGLAAVGLVSLSDAAFAASAVAVCKTTDIKVGSGKIVTAKGQQILITQPKKGVFKAFSPYCTHQRVMLAGINGTNLVCDQHGAMFDTTTGVRTNRSPARSDLQKYVVTVSGTSVKVTI